MRIAPASLRGFWPVILAEMMDIFTREEADPALIIAACKFLDLVLVLPSTSELFNLYEWMFITEGLETVRNPVYIPFVENLAEKLIRTPPQPTPTHSKHNSVNYSTPASAAAVAASVAHQAALGESGDEEHTPRQVSTDGSTANLRRPVITIRTISIGPNDTVLFASPWFHTFLSRFSRAAYQGGLSTIGAPDMDFIALLLAGDFSDLESEGGDLAYPNATATVLDIDEFEMVDPKVDRKSTGSPSPLVSSSSSSNLGNRGSGKWMSVNYKKESDKDIIIGSAVEKESITIDKDTTREATEETQESNHFSNRASAFIDTKSHSNILSVQGFDKSGLFGEDEDESSTSASLNDRGIDERLESEDHRADDSESEKGDGLFSNVTDST